MRQRQALYTRYSDLLPSKADKTLELLVAELDRMSNTPQPPLELAQQSVAQSLQAREVESGLELLPADFDPGSHWIEIKQRRPRRFSHWWPVAGLLMIMLMIATFAAVMAFGRSSNTTVKVEPDCIPDSPVIQKGNSLRANCLSFNVGQVMIDGDRIAIDFGFSGSYGPYYRPTNMRLTDDQGREYQHISSVFIDENNALSSSSKIGYNRGGEEWFDATPLNSSNGKTSVRLRLEIDGFDYLQQEDIRANARATSVKGPFVFEIASPLIITNTQVVRPGLKDTSRGTTVTLEKVVVTPNYLRLYVRGLPATKMEYVLSAAQLGSHSFYQNSKELKMDNDLTVVNLAAPVYNDSGEWSLLIQSPEHVSNPTRPVLGPWFFRFYYPGSNAGSGGLPGVTPTMVPPANRGAFTETPTPVPFYPAPPEKPGALPPTPPPVSYSLTPTPVPTATPVR